MATLAPMLVAGLLAGASAGCGGPGGAAPADGPRSADAAVTDAALTDAAPADAATPRPTQVVWEKLVGQDADATVFDLATTGDGVVVDSYPALAKYDAAGNLLTSRAVSDGTTYSASLYPWKTNGVAALTRDASGAPHLDFYDDSLNPTASVALDAGSSYSVVGTDGSTTYLLQDVAATQTQPEAVNLITVASGAVTSTQPITVGQQPLLAPHILGPSGHILLCWAVTEGGGTGEDAAPPSTSTLEILHIDPATGQSTAFPIPGSKGGGGCRLVNTKDGLFAMWWDQTVAPDQVKVAALDSAGDAIVAGPRTVTLPAVGIIPTSLVYDGTHIVGSWIASTAPPTAHLFTIDPDTLTVGPTYTVPTTYYDETHNVAVTVYQGDLYVALAYGVRTAFHMSTPARTIIRKLAPLR